MPCWYFNKNELIQTPSFRDGIESEVEARYRREGARFLMDLGNQMGLRYDTMATGVVFFHRFFMFHSFNEFPRYVMATCCLFLAGKVEETPKKCKDIIKSAKVYLESKNLKKHSDSFGEDPLKEVMTYERILLQTIKFDLQVDHPYGYLVKYAKSLKGNQEQIRAMVQMAWTFINDSFCTTLCLQWEPEIIAIALMYLTSKLSKLEITDWIDKKDNFKQYWWEQFVEGLGLDILEDICHQILDLYATQKQQQEQQQKLTDASSTKVNNNKRKTPPPNLSLTPTGSSMNDSTSPTSAKLIRTYNNSDQYQPITNNYTNNTTPSSSSSSSSSTSSSNSNMYYQNANDNYHPLHSHPPPPPHHPAYGYNGYNQMIIPPPMPPMPPGVQQQPPLPPPPPPPIQTQMHHFHPGFYAQMQHGAYGHHPFNSNFQPFNMNQIDPYHSMYNTGVHPPPPPPGLMGSGSSVNSLNKQQLISSGASGPASASTGASIRTSALKTINITDRPN